MEIDLVELFSGIGGFTNGLISSGFVLNNHYFSEVDKHAIANYKYNFNEAKYIGSVKSVRHIIRTVNANRVGGGKLVITFGSPCQDFSLAGKGKGLDGSKSSLIKYAIFLIRWLKPDVFIWENVKGAYSTNDGADYWAIIQAFANLDGYRFEQQLLNTAWFLPQNRERIYLIGHLTGRSEPGVFPISENGELFDKTFESNNGRSQTKHSSACFQASGTMKADDTFISVPKLAGCLTGGGNSGGLHSDMTTIEVKSNTKKGFDIATENDSINLSVSNSKTRRGRVGVGVVQTLDTQCNQGVIVKPVLTPNRLEKRQNGRRFKENGENSFTLSCQDQHGVMINNNIRRLTEIECERLQGFPDNWTKYGTYIDKKGNEIVKEIPKTQRYKMCGNAVTVEVVKQIGLRLNKCMIYE